MKKIFVLVALLSMLVACKKEPDYSTPIDGDGNVYATLQIGSQLWMVGALRTTSYNDGTPITIDKNWNNADNQPVCCYYNNDAENGEKYGLLYNWYAVKSQKLAPKGWHVATRDDWLALIEYYGGRDKAAIALKAIGEWPENENASVTNASRLGLLPSGCRETYGNVVGEFEFLGEQGFWWTSTAGIMGGGVMFSLKFDSNLVDDNASAAPNFGCSVLCVMD